MLLVPPWQGADDPGQPVIDLSTPPLKARQKPCACPCLVRSVPCVC